MDQLKQNKAQAVLFLKYLTEPDIEQLQQLLADDMQYILPGKSPLAMHLTSAKAFIDVISATFSGKVANAKIEVSNMTAEDHRVAVEATGVFKFSDGLVYENTYHFLFFFNEQHLITQLTEHMDSYHATKLFVPNESLKS